MREWAAALDAELIARGFGRLSLLRRLAQRPRRDLGKTRDPRRRFTRAPPDLSQPFAAALDVNRQSPGLGDGGVEHPP